MVDTGSRDAPTRGRQAEAAANDTGILKAAFDTLTSEPGATMADIASHAGVGVASLYRRYPTRQALVHGLCLRAMGDIAETADRCTQRLGEADVDPWSAFVDFVTAAMDSGAGALRVLAGSFVAGPELADAAARMNAAIRRVVQRLQRDGVLRTDVSAADITLFFEMLRAIRFADPKRNTELRSRYLALFATALRPADTTIPLPVPAPKWQEISASWSGS